MQCFPRARVLLPGSHNGNQVQDAGLIWHVCQSRKHVNVYVHAHGHARATQHVRTCALCRCMTFMPDGLEGVRAYPDQPAHASRCMSALAMVSLDTVGRVWGAGRARGGRDHGEPHPCKPVHLCANNA